MGSARRKTKTTEEEKKTLRNDETKRNENTNRERKSRNDYLGIIESHWSLYSECEIWKWSDFVVVFSSSFFRPLLFVGVAVVAVVGTPKKSTIIDKWELTWMILLLKVINFSFGYFASYSRNGEGKGEKMLFTLLLLPICHECHCFFALPHFTVPARTAIAVRHKLLLLAWFVISDGTGARLEHRRWSASATRLECTEMHKDTHARMHFMPNREIHHYLNCNWRVCTCGSFSICVCFGVRFILGALVFRLRMCIVHFCIASWIGILLRFFRGFFAMVLCGCVCVCAGPSPNSTWNQIMFCVYIHCDFLCAGFFFCWS